MRGRDIFRRYEWLIRFTVAVFRLLPGRALEFLWIVSDLAPGVAGVGLRYCVAKVRARACGAAVFFGPGVEVRNWSGLEIGSNVSIHRGCWVDAVGGVWIGSNVSIAHQCSILTSDHTYADPGLPIRDNALITRPVRIADDVWVGCGARVLAGVCIPSRCIVAAGAVVTRSPEPATIVGGVPAKLIKRLG